jgi:hypothetical protein
VKTVWPPNRTLRTVWMEVRRCSGGVKNSLDPPACGALPATRTNPPASSAAIVVPVAQPMSITERALSGLAGHVQDLVPAAALTERAMISW